VNLQSLIGRTTRSTVVGAICAVAYNVVMTLGGWAGGHYVSLSFLSFCIITPLGYLLHAGFTFRTSLSAQQFLRFASGQAAGLPLNLLIIGTLCSGLGLTITVASPITTILLYLWNYASAHWALRRQLPLR
jgi:putative flippase GtrA